MMVMREFIMGEHEVENPDIWIILVVAYLVLFIVVMISVFRGFGPLISEAVENYE